MTSGSFRLKRVYDPPSGEDGHRFLIDRLWLRGIKKGDLQVDGWLKEVAPSPELRKWFGHDPDGKNSGAAIFPNWNKSRNHGGL